MKKKKIKENWHQKLEEFSKKNLWIVPNIVTLLLISVNFMIRLTYLKYLIHLLMN